MVGDSQGGAEPSRSGSVVITDARTAASVEMRSRVRRYTFTMAFRTACFITMVFVTGPMRWVLFAGALVLPYVAVILANQANQRSIRKQVGTGEPIDRPQLTTGPTEPPARTGDATDDRDHRGPAVA